MTTPAPDTTANTTSSTPRHVTRTGLPPGSRLPALVQTAWLLSRPASFFATMRRRFGDVFTVHSLNERVVVGTTAAHARQVFGADPSTFKAFAVDALGPVLGEGSVLALDGEPHRRARKLLQPPFHGPRMRAYSRAMRDAAVAHVGALRPGDEIKVHELTTKISLEVISRTVFGVDADAIGSTHEVLREVGETLSPMFLFSKATHTDLLPAWRRNRAARARFDRMVDDIIARRRAAPADDIVSMFLATTWDDGSPLTERQVADHLLTLLFAGHETTAISLAWAVHDVFRRPAVLTRLRDEIATLGPEPDPDALAKLPFLSAVCDESLRLRPIVSDVVRKLVAPLEVGGYTVPAGMGVSVAIESIHTDPTLYPEPEAFKPERFLEKKPGPFEFLPFGGGHRRCIGAAFSDHEARIVLGTLVAQLDLTITTEDERVRRNITMGPRRGVPARVVAKR